MTLILFEIYNFYLLITTVVFQTLVFIRISVPSKKRIRMDDKKKNAVEKSILKFKTKRK